MPSHKTASERSLWKQLAHSGWMEAAFVCSAIGAMFALIAGSPIVQQAHLDTSGVTARGIIETLRLEHADLSPTQNTRHLVTYSFATAADQPVRTTRDIASGFWTSLHENETVRVVYLAASPDISRLAGEPRVGSVEFTAAGLGVSLVAIGLVLARIGARHVLRPVSPPAHAASSRTLPTRILESIPPALFAAGLLGSVGLTFLLVGSGPILYAARFRRDGQRVQAVVLSKGVRSRLRSSGGLSSPGTRFTERWVRYRFATMDGRSIEAEDSDVSPGLYYALTENQPLTVEYLAHDPDVSRPKGTGGIPWLAWFMSGLGLVLTGVAGAILLMAPRRPHRMRKRQNVRRVSREKISERTSDPGP